MPPGWHQPPIAFPFPYLMAPLEPSIADLYAYPSFRITQDDDAQILYVSGIVGNKGYIPARSVTVAVGVSLYLGEAFRRTDERLTRIEDGLRPGDLAYTEPTAVPLEFHSDGYTYILETLVDINHELSDLTRDNNHYSYSYWAYPIGQLRDGKESQTFSFTAEDIHRTDGS
jgi:hypothetical protein